MILTCCCRISGRWSGSGTVWVKLAERDQSASRTRLRSRSCLAQPCICRLIIFTRLTWPSTGPLFQGRVSPAVTASWSRRRPVTKECSAGWSSSVTAAIQDSSSWPRSMNRPGVARGSGSGHLAPLGDGASVHGFPLNWGHVVDGRVDSFVVIPTNPLGGLAFDLSESGPVPAARTGRDQLGLVEADRGSINALSRASPTVPIDPAIPASASSSVNASAVYREPASEWWINPREVTRRLPAVA